MDPLGAAIQFELGELRSSDLPDVATGLLAAGYDSPSLRIVAGDMKPEMADAGKTFASALQELGVALTVQEACLLRAEFLADGANVSRLAFESRGRATRDDPQIRET